MSKERGHILGNTFSRGPWRLLKSPIILCIWVALMGAENLPGSNSFSRVATGLPETATRCSLASALSEPHAEELSFLLTPSNTPYKNH